MHSPARESDSLAGTVTSYGSTVVMSDADIIHRPIQTSHANLARTRGVALAHPAGTPQTSLGGPHFEF